MIISDLYNKHRNALVKVLGKLNAANEEYIKKNNDELARIIVTYLTPLVSNGICSLKKNKSASSVFVFYNEKMGRKFMKLMGTHGYENIFNDLIVLLNSFKYVNNICNEWETWSRNVLKLEYNDNNKDIYSGIDECKNVFFNVFGSVKTAIEKDLISQGGYLLQYKAFDGKCRVVSRKKCECLVICYMNIVNAFWQVYDAFAELLREKEYASGWNDCEGNCRSSIETACTDAAMSALDCLE